MTSFPVWKNNHARFLFADYLRDLEAVLPGVLHPAVRNIKRLPPSDFQYLRSGVGFASAILRRSTCAQLTFSQIKNPGGVAKACHFEQSPAAGLLHVVAVRGNGKYVDAHELPACLCVSVPLCWMLLISSFRPGKLPTISTSPHVLQKN